MLKISVIESRSERRLILEGKLLAPQVTELRTASEKARADVQNLVIDLKNLMVISQHAAWVDELSFSPKNLDGAKL